MRIIALCSIAALLVAGCSTQAAPQAAVSPSTAASASSPESAQWLFALQSKSGSFTGSGDNRKLLLNDVDQQLVAFTDHPHRQVRTLTASQLVTSWNSAFGTDPPNAAITLDNAPTAADAVVVELGAPTKVGERSLAFPARVIPAGGTPIADEIGQKIDSAIPEHFAGNSLFIDSGVLDFMILPPFPDDDTEVPAS